MPKETGRKLSDTFVAEVAPPPEGGGAAFVMVSYDAARTRVESVLVGGKTCERVARHTNCFVVEAEPAATKLELETSYTGLPLKLLEPVQPVAAPTLEKAKQRARAQRLARIRGTLQRRIEEIEALDPEDEDTRYRRFFLSFEALTLTEVLSLVQDGELIDEPEFARVFRSGRVSLSRERAEGLAERIERISDSLPMYWLDDAICLGVRLHGPCPERAAEIRRRVDRTDPLSSEDVPVLASYLLEVFSTEFEIDLSENAPLDPDLVQAFTRFANGQLVSAGAGDSNIANGEPNSAMFLAFGEFALAASQDPRVRQMGQAHVWTELARLFISLQEVFLVCYGPRAAPRTQDRFNPARLAPKLPARPLGKECLRELRAFYKGLALDSLLQRHSEHVYWTNRDDNRVVKAWEEERRHPPTEPGERPGAGT